MSGCHVTRRGMGITKIAHNNNPKKLKPDHWSVQVLKESAERSVIFREEPRYPDRMTEPTTFMAANQASRWVDRTLFFHNLI